MKNTFFTTLGVVVVLVISYLIIAAPISYYKTDIVKELFAFQYSNPAHINDKEWIEKTTKWRIDNYLTAPDISDFYFPYTSIHAFTVSKYSLIPNDSLGKEFHNFIQESLPSISEKADRERHIKQEKLLETIRQNEGA